MQTLVLVLTIHNEHVDAAGVARTVHQHLLSNTGFQVSRVDPALFKGPLPAWMKPDFHPEQNVADELTPHSGEVADTAANEHTHADRVPPATPPTTATPKPSTFREGLARGFRKGLQSKLKRNQRA